MENCKKNSTATIYYCVSDEKRCPQATAPHIFSQPSGLTSERCARQVYLLFHCFLDSTPSKGDPARSCGWTGNSSPVRKSWRSGSVMGPVPLPMDCDRDGTVCYLMPWTRGNTDPGWNCTENQASWWWQGEDRVNYLVVRKGTVNIRTGDSWYSTRPWTIEITARSGLLSAAARDLHLVVPFDKLY